MSFVVNTANTVIQAATASVNPGVRVTEVSRSRTERRLIGWACVVTIAGPPQKTRTFRGLTRDSAAVKGMGWEHECLYGTERPS